MYIQQAFNYKHEFWRYLLGSFLIIIGVLLGQIPLAIAVIWKVGPSAAGMDQAQLLNSLDPNFSLFLMLLTFAVGLGAVLLVAKLLHDQSVRSLTTTRKKIDWERFFFAFGLVAGFTLVITLLDYFMHPDDYQLSFQPVPFFILCAVAIIMIPLQTSFEEYFFRGYLMQGIGTLSGNKWLPLFVTSFVFGGLHFFNPEVTKLGNIIMIYYIGTGFMLGIMTLMDEGMELSLGFHAGNNLIAALLVTADWTAFKTYSIFKDVSDPSAGWDVLIPVLVVYPIFLFILSKKYGWSNWQDKLFGKVEKPENLNLSKEA